MSPVARDNHGWLLPVCEVLSVPGHATMLTTGRQHHRCSAALRRSEAAVEEASDQPGGDAYLYAVRDEQAYLRTDDDKPVFVHPPPDPAQFKCWFCRKSHQQVQTLFGAEYPVRDPTTSPTRRRSSSATSALPSSRSRSPGEPRGLHRNCRPRKARTSTGGRGSTASSSPVHTTGDLQASGRLTSSLQRHDPRRSTLSATNVAGRSEAL